MTKKDRPLGGLFLLFFGRGLFLVLQRMAVAVDLFGSQAVVDPLPHQGVEHREGGHAQDHAGEAKQAAAGDNGDQHPDGGQAGAVAQDLGPQDVAVKLLQSDDQGKEPQGGPGVHDHQDEQTGNGADDGAEEGDHVGDAHGDAHQHGVRDAQDEAQDEALISPNNIDVKNNVFFMSIIVICYLLGC